ncbi:MAG: hypothetical protein ACI85J_000491 [Candidatus Poriferisodalaceae bacterium]|jgi:hypothetical protein|tara:strand:- start:2778 stop:3053 length:276 start_codon:yes stop_codon:yes gene_type:complete
MELLNPSYEETKINQRPADRLLELRGKTVGIISNGKENTAPFFEYLSQILEDKYGVQKVVQRIKSNYSAPAEDELMAEIVGWDAVLSGVGD